jgi:hypothetical protein
MNLNKERNEFLIKSSEGNFDPDLIENFKKLEEILKIDEQSTDSIISEKIFILIKNALGIEEILKKERINEEIFQTLINNFQSQLEKLNKNNYLQSFQSFFLKKISNKKVNFKDKGSGDSMNNPKGRVEKYVQTFFNNLTNIMKNLKTFERISIEYILHLKNKTEKKKEIFDIFSMIFQLNFEQKQELFGSIPYENFSFLLILLFRTSILFTKKEYTLIRDIIQNYIDFLNIDKKHKTLIEKLFLDKNTNEILHKLYFQIDYYKNIREIIFKDKLNLLELYKLYLVNNQLDLIPKHDVYYLAFFLYVRLKYFDRNCLKVDHFNFFKEVFNNQDNYKKDVLKVKDRKVYFRTREINQYAMKESDFLNKSDQSLCGKCIEYLDTAFINDNNFLNKLLQEKNFYYVYNLIQLTQSKDKYITNDLENFKQKLLILEKFLVTKFIEFKNPNDDNKSDIFSVVTNSFNTLQIESYARVLQIINDANLTVEFDLIPYGSVVQFLGKDDSDLDLYVALISEDSNILCKNWLKILNVIEENYGSSSIFHITKRLCIIKFTDKNGVKIDLNYFGKCGVINSHLIRYYSLIDVRFCILVYNLKFILKVLKISNAEKIIYLNSYSWVFLLITFLQDVIDPPVLPKLLESGSFIEYKLKVFDYKTKNDKLDFNQRNKKKLFKQIFNRELFRFETYNLYEFPLNYIEKYQKFQAENDKNNSSVAVLLLNFIDFMTIRFNPDSMYIDSKLQKVMNKSEVIEESQKIYFMKNITQKKNNGKYYIRDAFDHTYNPAKDLNEEDNYNSFKENLNKLYKNILETGLPY